MGAWDLVKKLYKTPKRSFLAPFALSLRRPPPPCRRAVQYSVPARPASLTA